MDNNIINKMKILSIIFIFALMSFVSGFSMLSKLENFWQDRFLKSSNMISPDIEIIAIDDRSIEEIGRFPWDRSIYGDLLNTLSQGDPAVIAFDITFSEPSENHESDLYFADAIKNAGNVIIPVQGILYEELSEDNERIADHFIMPIDEIKEAAFDFAHVNTAPDDDSLMRRAIPYIYDYSRDMEVPSLNYLTYKVYAEKNNMEITELNGNYFERPIIQYAGIPGTINPISFVDVLYGNIDPLYFENKIVYIGLTASGTTDIYYTPASGEAAMYGVEIHANFTNNLLCNNYKTKFLDKNILLFGNRIEEKNFNITNLIVILIYGLIGAFIINKINRPIGKIIFSGVYLGLYFNLYYILYRNNLIIQIIYPIITFILLIAVELIFQYINERFAKNQIINVFGKYVSSAVVDKIIDEGESSLALGGEQRELSVIFFDIRGFTSMAEELEATEVVEMLNYFLEMPTKIIFKYHGMLDKYMGDAIMALFNVPYDMEDHAFIAVKTAVEVRDSIDEINKDLNRKYDKSIYFGTGINTGPAVVGNVGTNVRMDYTAIGDTVNIASRLESKAKENQILISHSTYELVKDRVNANEIGCLELKGKDEKILSYEIISIKE